MQEMSVMTDNDDNDQWPDEMINELPSAEKSDSGIFPGLDENNDLIPDSDQNFNGIPDWTEPILFYDADPPDFIYGIDFNNNGRSRLPRKRRPARLSLPPGPPRNPLSGHEERLGALG